MLEKRHKLLLAHLGQYITAHKKDFIEKVLDRRTRHITVVLEDIFQSQNSSAVIRTCECLGVQDVHVIENESIYRVNRKVLKGAHKWMTINHYRYGARSTSECFRELRLRGYKIVAADPGATDFSIDAVEVGEPVALVFGNELHGLSHDARATCDLMVSIPMCGFTGSMNISVSAALGIQTLLQKLRSSGVAHALSPEEKDELRLSWYRKIVRRSEIIEREFMRTIP